MRILPADVFDTLELSAYVHKGIGADHLTEEDRTLQGSGRTPFCIFGHAGLAMAEGEDSWQSPLRAALNRVFGNPDEVVVANNTAVHAINARKRKPCSDRVTWEEYTRELNIVRGE